MVISSRAKCIFVHIQKTGGSSIEDWLRSNDRSITSNMHLNRRHLPAREIEVLVGPTTWNSHFKFAIVRNPWDRLVSWYFMCVQASTTNNFSKYVREHAPTFEDFLTKTTTGIAERTTYNQLDYVTNQNGEIIVDHIGRFEALDAEFAFLKEKLALSYELSHANKSRHDGYRKYYSEKTREIVAQRFARDIRHFGYEF